MPKLVKKLSDNGNGPSQEPSTIDVASRQHLHELWSKIQDIIYCPVISKWQHALLEEFVRLTTVLEVSDAEGTNEILNFCRRADAVRLVECLGGPDFPGRGRMLDHRANRTGHDIGRRSGQNRRQGAPPFGQASGGSEAGAEAPESAIR